MASAYYNEIDPFAAAWLRELIARDVIAPGVVDERSIEDVCPDELAGFTQCHFFAGIGVHSYALRRAGWPDDYPIWTGSCPCQPFSAAGKREGFADERHLWPAFFHLIEQCEPAIVAGEQVAGGSVGPWFDLVQADLEAMGYAFGLVPLPAAGFGGAHIRDRAFWLGDAHGTGLEGWHGLPECADQWPAGPRGMAGRLADAMRDGAKHYARTGMGTQAAAHGGDGRASGQRLRLGIQSPSFGLAHGDGRYQGRIRIAATGHDGPVGNGAIVGLGHNRRSSAPMLGREAADWLLCRDGKWRPVGPGTFPLAHEAPARVGRLRGYGNAIDAVVAEEFYRAVIDILAEA